MTDKMQRPGSIVHALRYWAGAASDKTALILQHQQSDAERYSYGALDLCARRVAAALQAQDLAGRRILLQAEGFDFIVGLFGCFYAGAIPVPAHQPKLHPKQADRFRAMVRAAQLAAVIGTQSALDEIEPLTRVHPDLTGLRVLPVASLLRADGELWREMLPVRNHVAFIQFTSGSTADPKGVIVDHGNLADNQIVLQRFMRSGADTVMVSWLPLFHDMGLIAGLMHPLFLGATTVLMKPMDFIRRPVRWLRAVADHRGTLTGAPNFGYAYAAERIKDADLVGLDLRSLRVAFSGSEPVRADTLKAFGERFGKCGFDMRAFAPGYGLAESTLCVTGKDSDGLPLVFEADKAALERGEYVPAQDAGNAHTLVGCGPCYEDPEIAIVDVERGASVADGIIGEIWVRGRSVARGYLNNPVATAEAFEGCLQDGRGPFLRTGDLGFRHRGELVVTGRCKDLIIIRGRNFYPHDLERTVADCHAAILQTGVAVVAAPRGDLGEEVPLVIAETRRWFSSSVAQSAFAAVNTAIGEAYDLAVGDVVLIPPGALPRTSSGKIRRREILRRYLEGCLPQHVRCGSSLDGGSASLPAAELIEDDALKQVVADALKKPVGRIAANLSLRALGLDSLHAANLCTLVEDRWQRQLALTDVLGARDLGDLAALIARAPPRPAEEALAITAQADESHLSFPLTPMQQAYWVATREVFELGGRSLHGYLELEGDIDVARFERAWNRLIFKHEMLRAMVDDYGWQRVLPQVPSYSVRTTDLRRASPDEREQALADIRERMSHRRHELTEWPCFELCASLLPATVRIHWSMDGIFVDFRSLQLLLAQLVSAYRDEHFDAHPPGVTFRSYVDKLRQLEARGDYARSLQYWRSKVDRLAPPPQLPLERDPASLNDPRVHRREHFVSRECWERVAARAADHGLTPAGVLLTAYGRVLAQWSSQQHLTVNVPLLNRPAWHPEMSEVVGNFSTFTLVDMDFSSRCDFLNDAQRVQRSLHEAIEHGRAGGVRVLREINSSRGRIAGHGFPVVFTHLPVGLDAWDGKLLRTCAEGVGRLIYSVTQTPQVWIDCQVWHEDGGVQLSWDSIDALFPDSLCDDMFRAYCASVAALGADTGWLGTSEDLLPQRDRELIAANNSVRAPVPDVTVVELIEQRAAARARNDAIVAGAQRLTYAQLMNAADHYAERLKLHRVSRNSRVAIVMRKGWEQAVAVLAVLRAGAAYVPIDADCPSERRRYLLTDCAAAAVLVQPETRALLSPDATPVEVIDESWKASPVRHSHGIATPPALDDLAYIIYTSGTSGPPKGVVVSHRNLVSVITTTNREFAISERDSILGVTALHHDMSVFDLIGVLAAGGKLVLPQESERRDPGAWLQLLRSEAITLWNSVPALLEMLLDYVSGHGLEAPRQLRVAFVGGDWVTPALVTRAARLIRDMTVCSVGGPTETTLWNIWHRVPSDTAPPGKIPYGKPAPNNRYYILNSALAPCPVWVAGEMYCAGDGVSQGYLNSPERTAERFFWHQGLQERLYRTGDLGRLLPDGNIEFVGRADFQIKIQGVRIEAGEIEAAILRHCPVSAAVVTAVGEAHHKCLAAYVVPAAGGKIDGELESCTGAVVTDVADRISFKLSRRGLRQLPGSTISLPGRLQGEAARVEFLRRQSIRRFESAPVTQRQLGEWLSAVASLRLADKVLPKYRYPSGGGLYPVQIYICIKPRRIEELAGGYYYYDPEQHRLCLTASSEQEPPYIAPAQPIAASSAFTVYLVGALDAIEPLYGNLARDLCLLEAGYISQLLMEQASSHLLGLCPVGLQDGQALKALFKLDERHTLLHTLIGGPIAEERLNDWLSDEVAPAAPQSLEGQIVRTLKLHLPPSLVPRHVVTLTQLPLSANGKIDRSSLPVPEFASARAEAGPGRAASEPLTDSERRLAAIWAELLGHQSVGVTDNFFEIGGNSNLLVQFHVRLKKELCRNVPIAELFRCSTIRELAGLLDSTEEKPAMKFIDLRGRRQREAAARRKRDDRVVPHV